MSERPVHHMHLTAEWALWKWFSLRGAGFPADRVAPLASRELTSSVDQWLARLVSFEAKVAARLAGLDAYGTGRERKWLLRVTELVRALALPDPAPAEVSPLTAEMEELRQARAELEQRYDAEARRVSEFLGATVAEPMFREALVLQNRHALRAGLSSLAQTPADQTDSKTRNRRLLLVNYLQRYCTKNEHIGFFGPAAFGTFSPDGPTIRFEAGPSLLAWRRICFEYWGIATLASKLSDDADVKLWIAPRLTPTIRIEGAIVHHPEGETTVPPAIARLLLLCDAERTAVAIARVLVDDDEVDFGDPHEVYETLEQLEQQGLIIWKIGLPSAGFHDPERALRAALERIEAEPTRSTALGKLEAIEAARMALMRAAGDSEALDRASDAFEATFTALTGVDGTRNAGEQYAGRTLFYEDCRRDTELQLGPGILEKLRAPLAQLLQSARWYTAEIAARYRAAFGELYHRLRAAHGPGPIPYNRFGVAIDALFETEYDQPHPLVAETVAALQARWCEVLGLDASAMDRAAHRIAIDSTDVAARIDAAFDARGPGWPSSRFHSVDLSIAASSVDAIARDECLFVLGEIHTGVNLMSSVLALHPTPADVIGGFEADLPEPRVEIVSQLHTSRGLSFSPVRHDFDVEVGSTPSGRPRQQVIPVGALVVDEEDGRLVVRTRDGTHRFDIVAFHERRIMMTSGAYFKILPPADHWPRITIDSLVISRERWKITPAALQFAHGKTASERFLATRRWASQLGLPRFAFYKIHEERKPWFLDLESPALVENFLKQIRKTSSLSLSEMLPAMDELWLADAQNRRFTSELRIPAFDSRPWAPGPVSR